MKRIKKNYQSGNQETRKGKGLILIPVFLLSLFISSAAFAQQANVIIRNPANLPVPVTLSSSAAGFLPEVNSGALEASHVIKNAAGTLYRVQVYNGSGATQYYLLLAATSLPANGTRPISVPYPVAPGTTMMIEFATGLPFSTGLVVANSSTPDTLTVGAADSWYEAQIK